MNRKSSVLHWKIKSDDLAIVRKVAQRATDAWSTSLLTQLAELKLTLPSELDAFSTLCDVYHPSGSLRMGTAPANLVVDKNIRLWGTNNYYVATISLFPSAGIANPGLAHLALTPR